MLQRSLINFGQFMHKIEVNIDYRLVNDPNGRRVSSYIRFKQNDEIFIKPQSDKRAQDKGIKYLLKGVFVYGGAILLTILEMKR